MPRARTIRHSLVTAGDERAQAGQVRRVADGNRLTLRRSRSGGFALPRRRNNHQEPGLVGLAGLRGEVERRESLGGEGVALEDADVEDVGLGEGAAPGDGAQLARETGEHAHAGGGRAAAGRAAGVFVQQRRDGAVFQGGALVCDDGGWVVGWQ